MSVIAVMQAEKPIITIQGTTQVDRNEIDVLNGQYVFHDLAILSRTRKELEEAETDDQVSTNTLISQKVVSVDTLFGKQRTLLPFILEKKPGFCLKSRQNLENFIKNIDKTCDF